MTNAYIKHLINMVDGHNYICLLTELHNTPFRPKLELDKNRVAEAKDNLRNTVTPTPKTEHISILELLISLAIEYDNRVMRCGDDNNVVAYFWLFLTNTGLNKYDDIYFGLNKEICVIKIQEWCSMFNERRYRKDGLGSIFPLYNPPKDLRKVELFYQLCWYINESERG